MSVHNGERFLGESLESLRIQTYRALEILVIDDGSRDDTARILREWPDERLRIVTQERSGLTRALGRGLREARGELIARLDADDVAHADRIARQVAFLAHRSDVALCGTWATVVSESGRVLEHARPPIEHEAICAQLLWDNAFFHSSWCARAGVLRELGGYDETIERAQDYELATRIARAAGVANIPETLLRWRRSPRAISAVHRDAQRASVARTSARELELHVGTPLDSEWLARLRALWDGRADSLCSGDGVKLAMLVARLPRASGHTVLVELVALVAAALPLELPGLIVATTRHWPAARRRLLAPKRVVRMVAGRPGLRIGRALRRGLRGY